MESPDDIHIPTSLMRTGATDADMMMMAGKTSEVIMYIAIKVAIQHHWAMPGITHDDVLLERISIRNTADRVLLTARVIMGIVGWTVHMNLSLCRDIVEDTTMSMNEHGVDVVEGTVSMLQIMATLPTMINMVCMMVMTVVVVISVSMDLEQISGSPRGSGRQEYLCIVWT
jgi:hypothetical protein